ncbi:phosphoribosylformylglycinamidine cyclo-ligase, partial [Trichonephila inaurata madagascariensis]
WLVGKLQKCLECMIIITMTLQGLWLV